MPRQGKLPDQPSPTAKREKAYIHLSRRVRQLAELASGPLYTVRYLLLHVDYELCADNGQR